MRDGAKQRDNENNLTVGKDMKDEKNNSYDSDWYRHDGAACGLRGWRGQRRKNSEVSEEAAVVVRNSMEKEIPGESEEAHPENIPDFEGTKETLPEESQGTETAEGSSYEEPFGEEISVDSDTQKNLPLNLHIFITFRGMLSGIAS